MQNKVCPPPAAYQGDLLHGQMLPVDTNLSPILAAMS